MKIYIEDYKCEYIGGKLTKVPVIRHWTYRWIAAVVLFFFRLINHKHVTNKDELGRLEVYRILDIRGIKTCRYETIWGQTYVAEFMWHIGKHYF